MIFFASLLITSLMGIIANILIELLYMQMQMSHILPPTKDSFTTIVLKFAITVAFSAPFITFIISNQ